MRKKWGRIVKLMIVFHSGTLACKQALLRRDLVDFLSSLESSSRIRIETYSTMKRRNKSFIYIPEALLKNTKKKIVYRNH